MRVLHVIGKMNRAGAETAVMNIYRKIDREKIQFDFLVHTQDEADFDQEILSLGGKIYRLPTFTGTNYFSYKSHCKKFFNEHPDYKIVHGHIGSCASIYLSEAKKHGAVTIAHSHSQSYGPLFERIAFGILSYPTRYIADYFIACSKEAGIDRYGKKVSSQQNYMILPNGIDVNLYRCTKEEHVCAKRHLGYSTDTFVCGHVGRLTDVKNHSFLFKVFSELKKIHPNSVLLLAGRGELEEDLKKKAGELFPEGSVVFLGTRNDIPEIMKGLDLFLFPSKKEGLPVATVEAQSAGVPTLMSTGVSELAQITSFANRISLEKKPLEWAREAECLLVSTEMKLREQGADEVSAAGFDSNKTALFLEDYYFTIANK